MWSSWCQKRKIVRFDGIVLANGNVMKEVDKEGYTYVEIAELDTIKENEMKENLQRNTSDDSDWC